MSQFTEALVVSPLADGKTWVLVQPFEYDRGVKGSGNPIHVEARFMTDFASVPRLLWVVLPKWGKYGNATVIHDWLYWSQEHFSRAAADDVFLEAMTVLDVCPVQKYAMYWAVRLFGWWAWTKNKWERDDGFNRVRQKELLTSREPLKRPGMVRRAWKHMRQPYALPKS
jgi:hypothetical protein